MNKILLTLCIVQKGDAVLLGMKKRGFGKGRWNGFGGKVQQGESIEHASKRELYEESGIIAQSCKKMGILDFENQGMSDILQTHIYKVNIYKGAIKETDEMRPQWFPIQKIPFEKMWPDDIFWMPLLIENKQFTGRFEFNDNTMMIRSKLYNMPSGV